jgi:tetratricopeptide (TPR) repeat protein
MIKSVQLFILAILFFCGPLAAQDASTPPPQPKAGAAVDPDTTRIADSERNNAEARYKADIAEMRADILESQTNWFEILTSSMIALFGTLITVVVLILAWRLDKTARAEIAAAKRDMDAQVKEAEQLVEQAKEKVGVIDGHLKSAEELMRGKPFGEPPKDPLVRKALADLAADAEKKPKAQRNLDDYRALVIDAFIKQNWSKMESRATAMAYLFEDEADDEAMIFALSQKGYALGQLNRHEDAIAAYDDVITRYGGRNAPALQKVVAMALVNKGAGLNKLNRHEDAMAAYDDVIARYGGSDTPALQEKVAGALVNRGLNLFTLNRHEDAVAAFDDVIARYGGSDDSALQEKVARAVFNKACSYALTKDVQRCIETLELWAERSGGMDMEAIKNDQDFDGIRNRKAFKAFLVKHGA